MRAAVPMPPRYPKVEYSPGPVAEHVITRDAPTHRRWDVDTEPVVRIQPGDIVTAETDDFAGGQITRDSTAADLPGSTSS